MTSERLEALREFARSCPDDTHRANYYELFAMIGLLHVEAKEHHKWINEQAHLVSNLKNEIKRLKEENTMLKDTELTWNEQCYMKGLKDAVDALIPVDCDDEQEAK